MNCFRCYHNCLLVVFWVYAAYFRVDVRCARWELGCILGNWLGAIVVKMSA